MRAFSLLTCLVLPLLACHSTEITYVEADLVLRGGRIATVDSEFGEVEALAISAGRVQAVGSNSEMAAFIGANTEIIELDGRRAIPGFIDGHAHFSGIGASMQILDLRSVANWDEVIEMVARAVRNAEPGDWIVGRGWHQEKWDATPADHVGGFPSHPALSAISPDNPVSLRHASGHASFFNARAMQLAGITSATPDPTGGEILHLPSGEPSGVFSETASGLVSRVYSEQLSKRTPAEAEAALRRSLQLADRECLAKGVTSFQDAGTSFATIETMRAMFDEGELDIRLWVMLGEDNEALSEHIQEWRIDGYADHHLSVRAIKRVMDGALGSRGAWFHEPYTDMPSTTGLNTTSLKELEATAHIAAATGFQLCVHAIGDRANTETLDIYERVLAAYPERGTDHRWRIEHAQHLSPADIPRFARLGVVASMQGVHCTSDAPFVIPRLGEERAESGAYVWRSLIDAGALVTNGTDAPVEDVDPLAGFYSSVTRRLANGELFYPDQRMARREALESYTIHNARAAFEEDVKGSLTPGKLADIVILSHDILNVSDEELLETKVLRTIVGGRTVYQAD